MSYDNRQTPEQEIDFCHDVMMTWKKYIRAIDEAERYEKTNREEPARFEALKQKRKLMALGQWPAEVRR